MNAEPMVAEMLKKETPPTPSIPPSEFGLLGRVEKTDAHR